MVMESISYETLLDQLHDGIYFLDGERRITYWNKGAERITGHDRAEVVGTVCAADLLGHLDANGAPVYGEECPLALCMTDGVVRERELYFRHKNGQSVPVITRISPILNSRGEAIGALEVFSDNTSKLYAKHRIEELEELALICPLTGVGNRRYAQITLQNAFEELRRYGWGFGLLFIDIDRFKDINDTHGHPVGDEVLRMTAHALRASLRSFDFVGRWGGEEFLVILPNTTDDILTRVAERCRLLIGESSFQTEGKEIRVTVSIGAVIANADESADDCVERADKLMYRSKADGRNRVTIEA